MHSVAQENTGTVTRGELPVLEVTLYALTDLQGSNTEQQLPTAGLGLQAPGSLQGLGEGPVRTWRQGANAAKSRVVSVRALASLFSQHCRKL